MAFDLDEIFIKDLDISFAFEIGMRTILMFAFVLLLLRLSGKKGVRQLSIFEVAIIIALGSAAGDPMFDKESAILPSLLVFGFILLFYRIITYIASKSEKFESVLEGNAIYIIEDGMFTLHKGEHTFAKDEFFAEMRVQGIEHTGQVKTAILETNGQISFFFYEDDDVKPGLPVLPKPYSKKSREITEPGLYACTSCAHVQQLKAPGDCDRCNEDEWVKSEDSKRIR
ncbi:DUF421 domain-containing protein [Chitinophaga rhizophila]|uniref:DUF421 domain-containing protein n=1 Tax=Chitinophaga rhizophila TaxID=2866212 RepID=A0ABS7GBU7_9BACT|nr:YetF domain-containing protein [Chitinophaga rhizophila]MBW8684735.1 DUF421 domain-containing protein [Chitinophaga rhizophila]